MSKGHAAPILWGALAEAVLGPAAAGGRISIDLPAGQELNGTAAQTVTLVLNELMTNAAKYGALAQEGGRVVLSVTADGETFLLSWVETGAGPVREPTKTGFGMRVLRGMTSATFGGSPTLEWRADGLAFSCRWRAEDMTA